MNRWEIVLGILLLLVVAWVFWPPRAKRHDHGRMSDSWRGGKVLDDELRQARERRSGRG